MCQLPAAHPLMALYVRLSHLATAGSDPKRTSQVLDTRPLSRPSILHLVSARLADQTQQSWLDIMLCFNDNVIPSSATATDQEIGQWPDDEKCNRGEAFP